MRITRTVRPLPLLLAVATSASFTALPAQEPLGGGTFINRVLVENTFVGWTSPAAYPPLVNFGAGALTGFVVNNCGNLAPGMQVACTAPAGTTAGRVLLSAAVWNPADGCPDCPVTTIDMELDHRDGVTVAPGQLVWPAIVQGAVMYVGPSAAALSNVWAKINWNALTAAQFCAVTGANALGLITACGTNPSFACTAAPLSFGFVVTVSSAVPTTRTHCYDNFRVVLNCPAQFTTFCAGCANCGVFPPAIGFTGGLPTIGNLLFTITETGACANVPTFLILGMSNTTCSCGPLPLNLTFLGFPLCNLCVSPDIIAATMTTAFGAASIPVGIPDDVYLIGAKFYAQWLDFGPPAIGMSNAAEILIGSP